uniref:C-type lectin domain-containing protein n=1 Tax=Gasterosteus aculeatus aculeatus TaxID=481459 RepID=A0AAQ4NTE8_GASAC
TISSMHLAALCKTVHKAIWSQQHAPVALLVGSGSGCRVPSDDPLFQLQRGQCPMSWYSFISRIYKYFATGLTWADAEIHCVSNGANLVSIHSLEGQKFVENLMKTFDPAEGRTWFGLSDSHREGP